MTAGDTMRVFYTAAHLEFPVLPAAYVIDPDDPGLPFHTISRFENGVAHFQVRTGYVVDGRTGFHEVGHMFDAVMTVRDPSFREKYWRWRFGGYPSAPQSWTVAQEDSKNQGGAWAFLPIESFAEDFSLAMVGAGKSKAMDWGKAVDPVAMKAWLLSLMPPQPAKETGMIDVRSQIPRADWSIGTYSPKTSVTVHWNGPAVPDDANPLNVIRADAQFHIDKNWGKPEDPVYGDGIMYQRLYARDGTVFQTRDDDAVLFHCGASGNFTSFAWQVMTGEGQAATPAQLASLRRDLAASGLPPKAHRDWSPTTCPGDELYALVHRETEEDMDQDTFNKWFDARFAATPDYQNTTQAIKDALAGQADAIRKLAADDPLDDAEVAALKSRIDKLRTI